MPDQTSVQIGVEGKDHGFGFDRVFGPTSTQEEASVFSIYRICYMMVAQPSANRLHFLLQVFASVSELVQSALDGYHVCLFSYGQTGAGKTHTMQGVDSPIGRGIIPRSVEKVSTLL